MLAYSLHNRLPVVKGKSHRLIEGRQGPLMINTKYKVVRFLRSQEMV